MTLFESPAAHPNKTPLNILKQALWYKIISNVQFNSVYN